MDIFDTYISKLQFLAPSVFRMRDILTNNNYPNYTLCSLFEKTLYPLSKYRTKWELKSYNGNLGGGFDEYILILIPNTGIYLHYTFYDYKKEWFIVDNNYVGIKLEPLEKWPVTFSTVFKNDNWLKI